MFDVPVVLFVVLVFKVLFIVYGVSGVLFVVLLGVLFAVFDAPGVMFVVFDATGVLFVVFDAPGVLFVVFDAPCVLFAAFVFTVSGSLFVVFALPTSEIEFVMSLTVLELSVWVPSVILGPISVVSFPVEISLSYPKIS